MSRPGERTLRYDDQNLYQYHLEFGVLTINEVRRSLGLPLVAWGDDRPAKKNNQDVAQAPPPAQPTAEDDLRETEEQVQEA